MNIAPRKIECCDTWQICKMGIHSLKKPLLTISMNLSQKKIQAMISHQHQNMDVAVDMDRVDEVAEEEECINVKQTSHPKESELKLYHHALYHPINLKHHPQDNRLKPCCHALYHPINLKHHPQDNRLKPCCHALYHPINLRHHPQDCRLKPCCHALYHPINLKHHPQDNRLKSYHDALYYQSTSTSSSSTTHRTTISTPPSSLPHWYA